MVAWLVVSTSRKASSASTAPRTSASFTDTAPRVTGRCDHALVGDAKLTLQALIGAVGQKLSAPRDWTQAAEKIAALRDEWLREWEPKLTSTGTPLSPYRVLWDLQHTVDIANTGGDRLAVAVSAAMAKIEGNGYTPTGIIAANDVGQHLLLVRVASAPFADHVHAGGDQAVLVCGALL